MRKRSFPVLRACSCVLLGCVAAWAVEPPAEKTLEPEAAITTKVGQTLPLSYPVEGLKWNSDIGEITIDPDLKKPFLVGKKQGEANLLWLDAEKKYHSVLVRVIEPDMKIVLDAVEPHIEKMIGVKTRVASDGIMLVGSVYYPRDKRGLEEIEKQFKGKVRSLVTEDYREFYPLLQKRIESELARQGLPKVDLVFVDNILQVKGTVPSVRVRETVGAILGDYTKAHGVPLSLLVDVNIETQIREMLDRLGWGGLQFKVGDTAVTVWGRVPSEKVKGMIEETLKGVLSKTHTLVSNLEIEVPKILVNIRFVAVSGDEGRQLGTDPAKLMENSADIASFGASGGSSTCTVSTGPLFKLLSFWRDKGKARTILNLDLPVYANEKEPAELRRVEEIRYQLTGSQGQVNTETVSAGLINTVLAKLEDDGTIKLTLNLEVSTFAGVSSTGIPNKVAATLKNLVYRLRFGQSAMLSNLDQEIESAFQRKADLLSQIPVLGMLFFQKRDAKNKTDHLFGIISILKPDDRGLEQRFEDVGSRGPDRPTGLRPSTGLRQP